MAASALPYAADRRLFRAAECPHPERLAVLEGHRVGPLAVKAVVLEEARQLVGWHELHRLLDDLQGLRGRQRPLPARQLEDDGARPVVAEPLGDLPHQHLRVQVLEQERGVDEVEAAGRRAELLRLLAVELEAWA